jgi:hypothetical protein
MQKFLLRGDDNFPADTASQRAWFESAVAQLFPATSTPPDLNNWYTASSTDVERLTGSAFVTHMYAQLSHIVLIARTNTFYVGTKGSCRELSFPASLSISGKSGSFERFPVDSGERPPTNAASFLPSPTKDSMIITEIWNGGMT